MGFNCFNKYNRISYRNNIDIASYINNHNVNNNNTFFPNTEYIVIWYENITNFSEHTNSRKLVRVHFLKLDSQFQLGINLPLEFIPMMPIGSIWKNGVSHEKFNFEKFSLTIFKNKNKSNYNEINHYDSYIKTRDKYAFKKQAYPVYNIERDGNTLLVTSRENEIIVIHPLLFFIAHYGCSQEINRILLTYPWDNTELPKAKKTVINSLHLDYLNPHYSQAVFIPDSCVICDAIFLYHLRNDQYSQNIVKNLNSRVRKKLASNNGAYLKVEPYHTQNIKIDIRGLKLDDGTILCTEITGISFPQGNKIPYDIERSIMIDNNHHQNITPLYQELRDNEVIVIQEDINTPEEFLLIKQGIITIGEMRKIEKNQNIDIITIANEGNIIDLPNPLPDDFVVDGHPNYNLIIEFIQIKMDDAPILEVNENHPTNHQYQKLLHHAQIIKEKHKHSEITIDCYTFQDIDRDLLEGEVIKPMFFQHSATFPKSIYVLRFQMDHQCFYIIDCEPIGNYAVSGLIVRVDDEELFLADDNIAGLRKLINHMGKHRGRLAETQNKCLGNNLANFKHMTAASSNWVKNALNKLI